MTARSLATSAQARDLDATMQLQALDQEPPSGDARARYRAGTRLARAHPREFTRYLEEELAAVEEAQEGAA
jgi:hypothetical protein